MPETIEDALIRSSQEIGRLTKINAQLLAALETLKADVQNRQCAHNCPGYDCATCTPLEGLAAANAAIEQAHSS